MEEVVLRSSTPSVTTIMPRYSWFKRRRVCIHSGSKFTKVGGCEAGDSSMGLVVSTLCSTAGCIDSGKLTETRTPQEFVF